MSPYEAALSWDRVDTRIMVDHPGLVQRFELPNPPSLWPT